MTTTSAAVSVIVTVPVTGGTISSTTATVNKNETIQLTATVTPADNTNKNVTWTSRNIAIAKVNSTGVVIEVAAGTVTIVVTTVDGNKTDTCIVTVTDIFRPVTGVTLTPTTVTVNKI